MPTLGWNLEDQVSRAAATPGERGKRPPSSRSLATSASAWGLTNQPRAVTRGPRLDVVGSESDERTTTMRNVRDAVAVRSRAK